MKEYITNEEFVSMYGDLNTPIEKLNKTQLDNRKTMMKVANRYKKSLSNDQIKTCMMRAVWRCLKHHEDNKGNKFTTSLWRFINWECKRELKSSVSKHPTLYIEDYETFDVAHTINSDVQNLKEYIALLSDDEQELVKQYYFERYTMKEIGAKHNYSKETARQNIKKVLSKLREMCFNGVCIKRD